MIILTTAALVDAALGLVLDKSAGGLVGAALGRLKARAARRELADIVSMAIEAAAAQYQTLASGLREELFVGEFVTPTVIDLVEDPSSLPDSEAVASSLLASLAAAESRPVHAGPDLRRALSGGRAELKEALVSFAEALRRGLAASEAWRDVAHRQVTEAINANVVELVRHQRRAVERAGPIGAEEARADAVAGSAQLREWPRDVWGAQIERPEFNELLSRIRAEPSGETLLVGEAGSGKSALLSALVARLEADGVPVLGVKADRLPADVRTMADVSRSLGMRGDVVACVNALVEEGPCVLLVDQLDAVSEVMDRTSDRMRLLLRLVEEVHPGGREVKRPPVHIVVSSRPFEADHDARFSRFEYQRTTLTLPTLDRVDSALLEVGVDPSLVPRPLRETIRRPFALKLFVGIAKRGGRLDDLLPSMLLARWLDTADLGDGATRDGVGRLLVLLADEMVRTETLWRPADVYEFERPEAFRRAVAAGLLVVDGGCVGYSHQSWLDDFQARGLSDARTLTEFAWRGQDGLFTRASVLRALQRLRSYDAPAYEGAVDLLLGSDATRRHLRYLVVDLVAGQNEPRPREAGWIARLLRTDPALARRAVPLVASRWSAWRPLAADWLPLVMRDDGMRGVGEALVVAEMAVDASSAAALIDRHWGGADRDDAVLSTLERARLWNCWAAKRLVEAMGRSPIAPHFVSHFGIELLEAGRSADAADVATTYLVAAGDGSGWDLDIYDLDKLVEAEPLVFASRLLPAFVALASRDAELPRSRMKQFAHSPVLDWRWHRKGDGSPFEALSTALRLVAERRPSDLVPLMRPFFDTEVEAVQITIADALASGGAALAQEGLEFLLSDPRRLDVGDAVGDGADGVIRTVHGWSSRELVRAVSDCLPAGDVARLRDCIEAWSRYPAPTADDGGPEVRRLMIGWAEEARLSLLAQLPPGALTPRRRRQVEEWRAVQPSFKGRMNSLGMANLVGSPMSAEMMARASDDQIVAMVEARHDAAEERFDCRRPHTGGARQLAQAFGEFAKVHPERAMRIVGDRLLPGRHEAVAGNGLRELAGCEALEPERIVALVRSLVDKGFASRSWRNEAGWAFTTLARRRGGLPDGDVALLETWLEDDPDAVASRVERRAEAAAENERRNARPKRREPRPALFGPGGGHVMVPQGNFTFLDAIGQGLLLRPEPDVGAFVRTLLRHTSRAEDPAVWSHTLLSYGQVLWSTPDDEAHALLRAVLAGAPDAFDDPLLVRTFWQLRRRLPEDVLNQILDRWLVGSDEQRQAAGEFVGGLAVVSRNEDPQSRRATPILAGGPSSARTGFAFSAVAAWSEGDPILRLGAHDVVVSLAREPDGDLATAIATAFSRFRALPPDDRTRDILAVVAANPVALEAALGHWLLDAISGLLVHPGFEDVALEALAAAVTLRDGAPARIGARGFGMGDDMVRIAIALQRDNGPVRARAMDIYERLLDANAYGAVRAAEASLVRGDGAAASGAS